MEHRWILHDEEVNQSTAIVKLFIQMLELDKLPLVLRPPRKDHGYLARAQESLHHVMHRPVWNSKSRRLDHWCK